MDKKINKIVSVYLLKNYQDYGYNVIVNLAEQEADRLIKDGLARDVKNRDFIIKPQSSGLNIQSRAFRLSPKIK